MQNAVANFLGKGVQALCAFIATPLYLHLLGIENVALISLFNVLFLGAHIFDLGLSATLNRDLAYLAAQNRQEEMSRLVGTFEKMQWAIGLILGAFFLVKREYLCAGALFFFQWSAFLYSAGLMGLQKQRAVNALMLVFAFLRTGGTLFFLYLMTPSLGLFLLCQTVAAALHAFCLRVVLCKEVPAGKFCWKLFKERKAFALHMNGTSITSLVLTQGDKLVLAQLLPLAAFGYYSLAFSVGSALFFIISPLYSAWQPRFTGLVAQGNKEEFARVYRASFKMMAWFILPVAGALALFPEPLLALWLQNADAAAEAAPFLRLFVLGTALNGLFHLPYARLLAYGEAKTIFKLYLFTTLFYGTLLLPATYFYGAMGAAVAYVLMNSGLLIAGLRHENRAYT